MKVQGYMNIYTSGMFHRVGKPGAFPRHPGDLYPTKEAALADIEPRSHYIATVGPVEWDDPENLCPQCPQSEPIPLSKSRREFEAKAAELGLSAEEAYKTGGLALQLKPVFEDSVDTSWM